MLRWMSRVNPFRLLVAVLALCAAHAALAQPLYLWEARKGGATVYLYGSVHLCSKACYPMPPRVEAAFKQARALVVELDPERKDVLAALTERMSLKGDDTLERRLPGPLAQRYVAALVERGLPEPMAVRLKPWFGTTVIALADAQRDGYAAELGIDRHFVQAARVTRKPVLELEGAAEQVAILDSVSGEDEVALTEQTLALSKEEGFGRYLGELLAAWRAGDAAALYEKSLDGYEDRDAGRRSLAAMVDSRNPRMAERIAQYAAKHKRVFVVVGALHLAGPASVQKSLEAAGFSVRQVDERP